MAKISTLSIEVDLRDKGAQQVIEKIGGSIKRLKVISGPTTQTIQKLRQQVIGLGKTGNNSISTIEGQIGALRGLRREADLNSKEFKQLTGDIEKYTEKLQKAQGKQKRRGLDGRQLAQGVGAIAAGGIFGGPEGLIGGGIGFKLGGPAGAAVGAAIGAQVGAIRKALGSIAEYGAQLNKLRIALRGVSASQSEYNRALNIVQQATKDFAIPQSILTKQFTKLQASVSGAGGTVADTETAFRGIVAAVRATGGSLNDVDAALTATAQVFSKGKVSAEELRQQIGERLPGAFTLFASSIGKTPAELDKALEDGKVTLQDFLTFSESIFEKYGETAQIIADGPEGAGDRLKVSLEELNEKVAPELARLGAQFQNFADNALRALLRLFDALGRFGKSMEEKIDGDQIELRRKALAHAKRQLVRTDLTTLEKDFQTKILNENQAFFDDYDFIGPPTPDVSRLSGFDDPEKPNGDTEKSRLAAERRALADLNRETNRAFRALDVRFQNVARQRAQKIRNQFDVEIEKAKAIDDQRLVFTLSQQKELAKIETVIDGLTSQIFQRRKAIADASAKGADVSRQQNKLSSDQASLLAAQEARLALIAKQEAALLGFDRKRTEEIEKQSKAFEAQFLDRQRELGLISRETYNAALLERERNRLSGIKELTPEQRARGLEQYRQTIDPTLGEGLRANISSLRNELLELTNPINLITNAATNIGTAFTNSFRSVIDGSATTQEALASFFKNIGNFFLDMAAQIIQKMIVMFILNKAVGLLPGMSGGGGGGGDIFSDLASRGGLRMADGGVFANNKIMPYAKGGIVNKPTMFAYANGGAGRFGIMGEAGPEAILPLRRGPGGKLGVESSGGGVKVGTININVENTGEQLSLQAQKQLAGQVRGIVLGTLANERRSGGML